MAELQQADATLEISVTYGTNESGPDAHGRVMIEQAAMLGFQPYAWTIMLFDFGAPIRDMRTVSIQAAERLDADVASAYEESASAAYTHIGISSTNGDMDESDETVPCRTSNRSSHSPSRSTSPG